MAHSPQAPRRRPNLLPHVMLTVLALSSLPRCSCEETQEFLPGARYEPDNLLDFGNVSVADEKTLTIVVRSNGSASLTIADALVEGASDKFTVTVPAELASLAPGKTSSISVAYRPCPDAWVGNSLKENFDYNTCPGAPDASDLAITDNTPTGGARITLSGQPVQPPVVTVLCPVGAACGMTDPNMTVCNGMTFGAVNAGETPCDLVIEVQNAWRNDKPVGDLSIERMEVIVKGLDDGRFYNGDEVGFSLHELAGSDLVVDTGSPFVVPIDAGDTEGAKRFLIRFSGIKTGLFRGEAATMTGLRLFTNDPDRPLVTAPLTAQGSAPDLTITIDDHVNFGPVEQGLTATATRTITNFGDATLRITDMRIMSGNPELQFDTTRGTNYPIELMANQSMDVFIHYTPADTGQDAEQLVITSNDPDPMIGTPDIIYIQGGAVPTINVDPPNTLVFALPQPLPDPPLPPRRECLTISNVGYGDLVINELEMLGSDDTATHPSVDDFEIEGIASCAGTNKCDPGITLCPPTNPGCTNSSTQLCIVYDNNDISTTDLVNLLIRSNDPVTPELKVVLDANDIPCFFPTPVITVETPRPCKGQPVRVNATSSAPGGAATGGTTITSYAWSWLFAQPPNPTFMPADAESTLFIPEKGGLYIIRLDLENSCGSRSQTAGQETVNVADTCN